eukprot:scaffold7436_cov258-Pinguiococcus_pyrenoidosus.AAC.1
MRQVLTCSRSRDCQPRFRRPSLLTRRADVIDRAQAEARKKTTHNISASSLKCSSKSPQTRSRLRFRTRLCNANDDEVGKSLNTCHFSKTTDVHTARSYHKSTEMQQTSRIQDATDVQS